MQPRPPSAPVYAEVTDAIIVCKNHLDIGFTEPAVKVVHDQINWMFNVAIEQARRLRDEGLSFCWSVGSWLVWEALERRTGAALAELERGIREGAIAWLATPFTTHTELMDEELVEAALAIARRLDERFGVRTIAGKLTDVPGHTRGLVPLLARAGVRFLHIGVNPMSPRPRVPDLFRWRDAETGAETIVAYSSSYAADIHRPHHQTALLFRMVGDNMEVPSPADVRQWFRDTRAAHPNAAVRAGRLDDFAATLEPLRAALPVVESEIGDSWIHGIGSDPWKVQRFRELMRLRKEWLRSRRLLPDSRCYIQFSRSMALVAEHTWGLSLGAYLPDTTHYTNEQFARARRRAAFRYCELSWQEQREYLDDAVEALIPAGLAEEAKTALAALTPRRPQARDWREGLSGSSPIRLDPHTGAVTGFTMHSAQLSAPEGLGVFRYRTFSAADLERFRAEYNGPAAAVASVDFGKPGLRPEDAESRWWMPTVQGVWSRAQGRQTLLRLGFPEEAHRRYGAPAEIWLEIEADAVRGALAWTLSWFDKTATRLPEAFWFSFALPLPQGASWRLLKLGREIDPADVVSRGGRSLHATGGAVTRGGNPNWRLDTPDAPLIAPGAPALARFTDEIPDARAGLHINLFNNLWGTNFPAWNEDDMKFRFCLSLDRLAPPDGAVE